MRSHFLKQPEDSWEEDVSTMKARSVIGLTSQQPVWCHRCCIRIAPYDIKTIHHGKNYHRDCYNKLNHEKAQARKN
jgi:hypothetical protein